MQLRQILTTFLIGVTFFVTAALGQFGYELKAQAAPVTAAARSYQVGYSNSQTDVNPEQAKAKAAEAEEGLIGSLKDTAGTIREKLNLDEPIPETTKTSLKQLKGEDVTVKEPRPSGKGQEPQNQ
jgi:hypothetical protein